MSIPFERIIRFTMRWEGGYVCDPDDPGKETKYGISKRAHPDVDIQALTPELAVEIYREHYWREIWGPELPPRIAMATLDWSVHSNRRLVVRHLQRVLGGLKVDGIVGSRTVTQACFVAHDIIEDRRLATRLVQERVEFLHRLMEKRSKLQKYGLGWMRRTHDLVAEIHTIR